MDSGYYAAMTGLVARTQALDTAAANLAANCGLSVPAVITGRDYHLHVQAPEFKVNHTYRFEDASFEVTIICDGLQ